MTKDYRDDHVPHQMDFINAAKNNDGPEYLDAELSLSGNLSFKTARFAATDGVYDDDAADELGDDID